MVGHYMAIGKWCAAGAGAATFDLFAVERIERLNDDRNKCVGSGSNKHNFFVFQLGYRT